jgi:tripartite-type tricarboxylate transporter receptor subunit TctC
VRPLAVLGERRIPELPDVPTVGELKLDINLPSWFGLFVPKGTPQPIIAKVSREVEKALRDPEVEKKLANVNLTPSYLDPAAFAKQIREDDRGFAELIRSAGIKAE